MPRQGTRVPRQPVEPEIQEPSEDEKLMAEIREVMSNVRDGVSLENTLTTLIEKLPESLSPQYRQILTIALGNVRKLNTNFLYREHSILTQIIPETDEGVELDEDDE